jgi:hypothetical protein
VDTPSCSSPDIPGFCEPGLACGRATCDQAAVVPIRQLRLLKSASSSADLVVRWLLDENADQYDVWWVSDRTAIPSGAGSVGLNPLRLSSIDWNRDQGALLSPGIRFYQADGRCSLASTCGACCLPTDDCLECVSADDCAAVGGAYIGDGTSCVGETCRRTVFATAATYPGNLGGVAGAHQKCQAAANLAGLAGTFKAWISDGSESPGQSFTHSAVPYTLVQGTIIAQDWDDLVDGSLLAPINKTETGGVAPVLAWTGTGPDGECSFSCSPADYHCLSWTTSDGAYGGMHGRTTAMDQAWTEAWSVGAACFSSGIGLYCFQQ